jgi:hypothetical protein
MCRILPFDRVTDVRVSGHAGGEGDSASGLPPQVEKERRVHHQLKP